MARHGSSSLRSRRNAAMLLMALSVAPVCLAHEQEKRSDPNVPDWPLLKNMTTQNFASNYETGTLFDEVYGAGDRPCFQPQDGTGWEDRPVVVDVSVPCAAMRVFFANCSLGISLAQENSNELVDMYPEAFEEIPNDQQQQCYCSGDYWAYNAGCNACLKLQDYPSNGEGWIPDGYVSQQSSAYCSAKPTLNFREFLEAFEPTQTLAPTADPERAIQRPRTTVDAPVSAYFTAPASTPVFLSGTSSISLARYTETTASKSSPSPTSNAGAQRTPLPLWPAALGLAALL